MKAFTRFLGKELLEMVRTWRLPVIGGVVLFVGVMSPIAAVMTPALISSLTAGQPGLVIKVPDPTYLDSYAQWMKNLSQIGMMLVIFSSAGLIASERASGTAALVVSKPVSRMAFVTAKFVAQAGLLIVAVGVGAGVVLAGTFIAFGRAPVSMLASSTVAWLALALLFVAVAELLSAAMSTIAAAVVTLVVWALGGVAALWRPAIEWTPVGLIGAPSRLAAGETVAWSTPAITALACMVLLVALAGLVFSRREL